MLVRATAGDTVHTGLFDIGWPAAPHRVLRNSTFEAWARAGHPAAPDRPGEGETVATLPDGRAMPRYGFAFPRRGMAGDLEAMALYAGQSVGLVRDILPAGEIVSRVGAEAARALERLGTLVQQV
jgi:NAD(P)H-dependent flavin oxidoreductase YrpB (nitropropane dioxygenase family)